MHNETQPRAAVDPYLPPAHPGSPETLPAAGGEVVPAGFVRRWAALFIDQLILIVPLYVLMFVAVGASAFASGDAQAGSLMLLILYPLYFVAAAVYYAAMESSRWQATLGKRALGIKVVTPTGDRIGFAHALGRWFAAALSYITLYIGFLMAAFTERKRALHDYVAGTEVVDQWAYTAFPERQKRGLSGCLVVFLIAMLMVPVLAILAAISISQYQDYVIRSQVSEGSSLANGVQQAVGEYAAQHSAFPRSNADAGLAEPAQIRGEYVVSMDVGTQPGRILVTYGGKANAAIAGKHLAYTGSLSPQGVAWACASHELPQKWCPSSCECTGSSGGSGD